MNNPFEIKVNIRGPKDIWPTTPRRAGRRTISRLSKKLADAALMNHRTEQRSVLDQLRRDDEALVNLRRICRLVDLDPDEFEGIAREIYCANVEAARDYGWVASPLSHCCELAIRRVQLGMDAEATREDMKRSLETGVQWGKIRQCFKPVGF